MIYVILVIALALRLIFFMGMQWADPQDDGIYLNLIRGVLSNGLLDHATQRQLVETCATINPVHIFQVRIGFLYPVAAIVRIVGINDIGIALFPLACSILGIWIVYKIGSGAFNENVGIMASLLVAIFPLDVIYATRLTPDVPAATLMTLAVYLCSLKNRTQHFLGGVAIGCGYLMKDTALLALVPVVLLVLWRDDAMSLIPVFVGLAIVMVCEGLYYWYAVGYPSLHYELVSKVYKIKYADEWIARAKAKDFGWAVIKWLPGDVLLQAKTMMKVATPRGGVDYFGWHVYPACIAVLYCLCRRDAWWIGLWLVAFYLFVEFGPIHITMQTHRPYIEYGLIEKQQRYLTVLVAPLCMGTAYMFGRFRSLVSRPIAVICLSVLAATSCVCCYETHRHFQSHISDMRDAAKVIATLPHKPVYADWIASEQIRYYSNISVRDIKSLYDDVGDCYVVTGGSRGADLLASYFDKDYHIANANRIKTISGKTDAFRKRDVHIDLVKR